MRDTILRINGEVVDLSDRAKIALNFQATDVGEIGSIKAPYTQKIKVANTENNHRILRNSNKIGADDKLLYGKIRADVIIDGIYILNDGNAIIDGYDSRTGYSLNILGGNYDFFTIIKDKTIRDLNLSQFDFPEALRQNNYVTNYNATSGICFPVVMYEDIGPLFAGDAFVDVTTQIPWIYKNEIISRIITEAGFTFEGEMFSFTEYIADIMLTHPPKDSKALFGPSSSLRNPEGFICSEWMPDILQIDFIKSVLLQYSQFITSKNHVVTFNTFDELDNNKFKAINLSGRADIRTIKQNWDLGYSIENTIKYEDADSEELGNSATISEIEDVITSRNKNLAQTKIIGQIVGTGTRIVGLGYINVGDISLPYIDLVDQDGLVYTFKDSAKHRELITNPFESTRFGSPLTFKFREGTNSPFFIADEIFTGYFSERPLVAFITYLNADAGQLSMPKLVAKFWQTLKTYIIEDPLKINVELYLKPEELERFREEPSTPVYLEELNGIYYVNKVNDFINGELANVELYKLFR